MKVRNADWGTNMPFMLKKRECGSPGKGMKDEKRNANI